MRMMKRSPIRVKYCFRDIDSGWEMIVEKPQDVFLPRALHSLSSKLLKNVKLTVTLLSRLRFVTIIPYYTVFFTQNIRTQHI